MRIPIHMACRCRGSRENMQAEGIAVYSFGITAQAFLALAGGGYMGDRFGWRVAFLVLGR